MRGRIWALCVLCVLPLTAQQEPSPEGKFSLKGTVSDAVTGQPVRRAKVNVSGVRSCLTDSEGHFTLEDLPQGPYSVKVSRPGYAEFAAYREEDASTGDLDYRLMPLAVVTGKVTDESGEAIPKIEVQVIRRTVNNGVPRVDLVASDGTDDRGEFRITGLPHERVFVKAAGRAGGTQVYRGSGVPEGDASEAFTPIYYGGAAELSGATPIDPRPGTETVADLRVKIEPGFRITGAVINMAPTGPAKLELFRGEETCAVRIYLNASSGRFSMEGVPAGMYTLRASQRQANRQWHGAVPVDVGQSNVTGVRIPLSASVDLAVHSTLRQQRSTPPQISLAGYVWMSERPEYRATPDTQRKRSFLGRCPWPVPAQTGRPGELLYFLRDVREPGPAARRPGGRRRRGLPDRDRRAIRRGPDRRRRVPRG